MAAGRRAYIINLENKTGFRSCQSFFSSLARRAGPLPDRGAREIHAALMLQLELCYALLGFTGEVFVAHADRYDLAEGLQLLDESERAHIRRILRLGFLYGQLEAFITAQLFGLSHSATASDSDIHADALSGVSGVSAELALLGLGLAADGCSASSSPSAYLLAFAEGLEEALQPYRARVLEVEQQLERTPGLSLAALQLGFAEWELALPALCQLLDTVQAAPPEVATVISRLHPCALKKAVAMCTAPGGQARKRSVGGRAGRDSARLPGATARARAAAC